MNAIQIVFVIYCVIYFLLVVNLTNDAKFYKYMVTQRSDIKNNEITRITSLVMLIWPVVLIMIPYKYFKRRAG